MVGCADDGTSLGVDHGGALRDATGMCLTLSAGVIIVQACHQVRQNVGENIKINVLDGVKGVFVDEEKLVHVSKYHWSTVKTVPYASFVLNIIFGNIYIYIYIYILFFNQHIILYNNNNNT